MAELPDIPTELSYDGRMINTKIVHTLKQVIKPVDTTLNGSTVSFNIPNNVGESYLNLKETKILLTCSIQKADGTKMKSTDKRVLPSNNFLASLFDNVQVMVNNTIISTQDMSYHMKATLTWLTVGLPALLRLSLRTQDFCLKMGCNRLRGLFLKENSD